MTDSDVTETPPPDAVDAPTTGQSGMSLTDPQGLAEKLLAIGKRRDPDNKENAKFYDDLGDLSPLKKGL
jgi:hypothetical protein